MISYASPRCLYKPKSNRSSISFASHRHLEHPVEIDRVLRMILVHDLVEAEVGPRKQAKAEREQKAIARIRDMLEPATGAEIFELFQAYELSTRRWTRTAATIAFSGSCARR